MVSIYKPTKAGNGSTCSFYLSRDEKPAVMVSLLRQNGWNNTTKKPIFASNRGKPGANIVVKLEASEVCSIIHSINTNDDWSGFHNTPNSPNQSSIKFGLYRDKETKKPLGGFNFGVLQTNKETGQKSSILIGMTEQEALYLKTFFIFCLNKQFEVAYESFSSKSEVKKAAPNPKPKVESASDSNDDFSDSALNY